MKKIVVCVETRQKRGVQVSKYVHDAKKMVLSITKNGVNVKNE